MLRPRLIPCLDIKDGRVVKGVNFVGLRDAGDPVGLARHYDAEGADELGTRNYLSRTCLEILDEGEERLGAEPGHGGMGPGLDRGDMKGDGIGSEHGLAGPGRRR